MGGVGQVRGGMREEGGAAALQWPGVAEEKGLDSRPQRVRGAGPECRGSRREMGGMGEGAAARHGGERGPGFAATARQRNQA